jgi:hypothetical protein
VATGLLDVIAQSRFPSSVKSTMREDLLENVSLLNQRWAERIVWENEPVIVDNDRYIASFQIRDLLTGDKVRAPGALRDLAYRKSLFFLSAPHRMREQINRALERHLMWRFKPKS